MADTPTQRTLKALRAEGYKCAIVEKWNPHARIRQDLFGIIDIIALDTLTVPGISAPSIIGVQSTGTAFAEHERKLLEEKREECLNWLRAGGRLQLWGWRKLKVVRGGKAYRYESRVREFRIEDFGVGAE